VQGTRRLRRAAALAAIAVVGLVSLTAGLAFLKHPVAGWAYGIPHRSDEPPVLGLGLLVVPVVLVGVGIWRLWEVFAVDLEVVRQRRERRAANHRP
jgi:hypothetical protein